MRKALSSLGGIQSQKRAPIRTVHATAPLLTTGNGPPLVRWVLSLSPKTDSMNKNKTKYELKNAHSAHAPAALGKGASRRLVNNIKSALAGVLLISLSSLPSLAQTEKAGIFENLPAQTSTNVINGTLGDIDALNGTLDDAIAKSSASVDAYAQAINEASASFSLAASNRVEDAEMECLRTCADGLRLFVANGPKALVLHQQITAKGDRVASMMGTRIATRIKAAKQLAQARNVPVDLVEVELAPNEVAQLKEWSVMSHEIRFTEAGNRLHVDRLEQIMAGVTHDRTKLAAEGESLSESLRRMEMLQRVVKRFAADAIAEQRYKQDAIEFHQQSERFGDLSDRYRRFTRLGEQSLQPRSNAASENQNSQNLQLGGPVK